MRSQTEWVESLSPWPEEFGLGRIRALLAELGHPQRAYRSIHVVGTNGKSTATRQVAAFLEREGLLTGAYTSPHVAGWSERIQVGRSDADLETALARVREPAERIGATQFEVLTAAALAEFAAAGVDVAVVEAGLGGRLDATNVLAAPIVVLTNVALDHADVLGATREEIAAEKLAVVTRGATVVLGEAEWEPLARANSATKIVVADDVARAAAEAFLGKEVDGEVDGDAAPPGRFDVSQDEVWAGAHNPAGLEWLARRLPAADYVLCVSILGDRDVEAMLERLASLGRGLVTTASSNPRSLSAQDLAERARTYFERVEAIPDPVAALARARELGPPVLVTGSLYLLQDLAVRVEDVPWGSLASG
jgi:dihydrofolate synthase/folylpolyglutamate synthase